MTKEEIIKRLGNGTLKYELSLSFDNGNMNVNVKITDNQELLNEEAFFLFSEGIKMYCEFADTRAEQIKDIMIN